MDLALYHQFAQIEDTHWWFRGRRDVVQCAMRQWLPAHQTPRILDVGCGTGAMLELLSQFGSVEGLDCESAAIDYCRQRFGKAIELHNGLVPEGLPDGSEYDLITAFDVIEHIPDAVAALRGMRDLLAPRGHLVCTVPAYQFLWSSHDEINHHCRRYTERLLRSQLTDAGFKVRRASYFNTLLFPPIAAIRLARRALGLREAKSDFFEAPRPINEVLARLFRLESLLVPSISLPFGVSLIAVAQR
jgi:SAM-dependent methyltransferase